MVRIDVSKYPGSWSKDSKTFTMSEKNNGLVIPFSTQYEVFNPATNTVKVFEFTHSTGPEFASDTRWVYRHKDETTEMFLEICNDPEVTKRNAAAYLKAKMR